MKLAALILGIANLAFAACQTNTKPADTTTNQLAFKDSLGHVLNKSDLAHATGQVNYEIMENKVIDPKAQLLHQKARALGQKGQDDMAIAKLNEAINIQPAWAYPTYDMAFTYLLKGDAEQALKFYKKTDELEPKGFFTAKTAIYALEGEKAGRFPKGLYMAYLQIEWTEDGNKKLELARAITRQVPEFAPAWKDLSDLSEDKRERLNAIEQGLLKNPDAETKGMLLIHKALQLDRDSNKEEAKRILGDLLFAPDATTGNIALAKFALKTITEK